MSADVELFDLIISENVAEWAAQDFESLADDTDNLPPFNYSEQSGNQYLSFMQITEDTDIGMSAGVEDFEAYPDGAIDKIDRSVSSGTVTLAVGYIYPEST